MHNFLKCSVAVACLAGAMTLPATARETVGVHVGDLGISVGNGHYYDRHHHRQAYTYPSDWRSYHHPRSWYQGHSNWNDRNNSDWYRN